ncbi:hypothetical protein SAMN02745129_0467 [Ferrimonas marina]|uniref:Uncharacterized protein n=1 Tax=Ferrimonas marina TaxID=299255 RepID=A0A1M5ZPX4_9GAMM|nr:hypothetical protein SAMN02745129_0467 [Ferrimonas marina]
MGKTRRLGPMVWPWQPCRRGRWDRKAKKLGSFFDPAGTFRSPHTLLLRTHHSHHLPGRNPHGACHLTPTTAIVGVLFWPGSFFDLFCHRLELSQIAPVLTYRFIIFPVHSVFASAPCIPNLVAQGLINLGRFFILRGVISIISIDLLWIKFCQNGCIEVGFMSHSIPNHHPCKTAESLASSPSSRQ